MMCVVTDLSDAHRPCAPRPMSAAGREERGFRRGPTNAEVARAPAKFGAHFVRHKEAAGRRFKSCRAD